MDHTNVQSNSRSRKVDGVQLFRLARQLEYRTRALLRLESRMRCFSLDLDLEDAGSLPSGLHASTGCGWLHHKGVTRVSRSRDAFEQRPSGKTSDLFITGQRECHSK